MSHHFLIEHVADGTYAAIVRPGTGAWGNAGIIDLGDRTVVFDTFATPEAATALRAAAEELTGRPPTLVMQQPPLSRHTAARIHWLFLHLPPCHENDYHLHSEELD